MSIKRRFNSFLCRRIFGCEFWPASPLIGEPGEIILWDPTNPDLTKCVQAQCRRCGKIMERFDTKDGSSFILVGDPSCQPLRSCFDLEKKK